jgi:hypothetical protein
MGGDLGRPGPLQTLSFFFHLSREFLLVIGVVCSCTAGVSRPAHIAGVSFVVLVSHSWSLVSFRMALGLMLYVVIQLLWASFDVEADSSQSPIQSIVLLAVGISRPVLLASSYCSLVTDLSVLNCKSMPPFPSLHGKAFWCNPRFFNPSS